MSPLKFCLSIPLGELKESTFLLCSGLHKISKINRKLSLSFPPSSAGARKSQTGHVCVCFPFSFFFPWNAQLWRTLESQELFKLICFKTNASRDMAH